MNILFTICARAGSKGIKNKNIRNFLGHPLVYYTISAYNLFVKEYGEKYNTIDFCVNTDSPELIKQLDDIDFMYSYIPRELELAGDTISKVAVIKDSFNKMEEQEGKKYDIVVDLDITSPLRRKDDLFGIINILTSNPNANLSFSMTNSRRSPYFNMVCPNENNLFETIIESSFIARQQAPKCFDMNASLYAYKRDFLINTSNKKVFDGNTIGYLMPDTAVLDLDNFEDFELLEIIAPYFYNQYIEYKEVFINLPLNS